MIRLWGAGQSPVGRKSPSTESLGLRLPGGAEEPAASLCLLVGPATRRFGDKRVPGLGAPAGTKVGGLHGLRMALLGTWKLQRL